MATSVAPTARAQHPLPAVSPGRPPAASRLEPDRGDGPAEARARLPPCVESLPLGWDSPAGAHGAAICGGQRQRLAPTRALPADPQLMGLEGELPGVERSRPLQILRRQPRRNATADQHDRSPPLLTWPSRIQIQEQVGPGTLRRSIEAVSSQAIRMPRVGA